MLCTLCCITQWGNSHQWLWSNQQKRGNLFNIGTQRLFCWAETRDVPVGHYTRVVTLLVLIHFHITHQNKGRVPAVGSDYTRASDGLREVGVYGGAADRLQALELPRRGNVKSLQASRRRETNTMLQLNTSHMIRCFKSITMHTYTHRLTHTRRAIKACANKTPAAVDDSHFLFDEVPPDVRWAS